MSYPSHFSIRQRQVRLPSVAALLAGAWVLMACGSEEAPVTPGASVSGATTTTQGTTSATAGPVGNTVGTTGQANATTTGTAMSTATATSATSGTSTTGATAVVTGGGGSTGTLTSTGDGLTTGAGTLTSTTGGQSGLTGGASGKYVCVPGATYGDPLAGMGAVQEIGPPSGGYFAFIEGPLWIASLGKLYFSDHSSPRRIFTLTPGGVPEVFDEDSGSNGLALDNDNLLIVAEELGNRVTRVDPTSGQELAELVPMGDYGPNDVIYRSDGNIYFTDPSRGLYRVAPEGTLSGPMTEVQSPNGVVLSPDENALYVGDVNNQTVSAFLLMADGSLGAGGVWATTQSGTVDGMAVDCAGNVYAGTANGVEVFSPAGAALGVVPTGESSNVTFGGVDRQTLYVTSRSLLKAVTLAVPGLPD